MLTIDLGIYEIKEMTNQDKIITRICTRIESGSIDFWLMLENRSEFAANTFFFDKVTIHFLPVANSRQT